MSIKNLISPQYQLMSTMATPAINFGRGIFGFQDPVGTQEMKDRMLELESQKGKTGVIGYEDYGLETTKPQGRFTGGLFNVALNRPVDFALAGSVGRYGFSPEGRTGLTYDFTPDQDTGSTGNAFLDFINEGGLRGLFNMSAVGKEEPMSIEDFQVQNIEDRPVASIPSNFLNYRFQEDRTPFTPVKEGITTIKDKALDFLGSGKELALRGIGSIFGGPVGSFIGGALANLRETPEQKTIKGLYDLDSIGRIRSGLMAGYNPVSAFGPTGLSGAMIDRINKINQTLNNPKISKAVKARLDARKKALQEKIEREQAAMRETIERQYRSRPGEYGGPDRQTEREQAGPGYDKVSEAGSF